MPRVTVTAEESAFIRQRLERFAQEAPKEQLWQADYVRTHEALPLFIGWTETLGIRADGVLIRWSTEGEWPGAREFDERTWVNVALVQGAARYPALKGLIPKRPDGAETCEGCKGTGIIAGPPEHRTKFICRCGGTGWLPREDG